MPVLATCRFGTSEIFFSSANNLVSDGNTQEQLVYRTHISPRLHLHVQYRVLCI